MTLNPSMKLGAYELLERIAVGGMAEVYRGRAVGEGGFEKSVAIKRILPNMARDERFVTMMVQEARIQSGLSHRNIVQIHDLGVSDEGEYFIVLEYVDGRDLGGLMGAMAKAAPPGNRMGDSVALHLVIELGEGLQSAHQLTNSDGRYAGLVHRDISPSNVLISYAGEVKLSDFGLAKRRNDESVVVSLKGKLAYMSPEQARRWPLDQRTDIFALGAVLFELVTGRPLRDIVDESVGWSLVASGVMTSPRSARPDIPVVLERLLDRALAPDAKDRFTDVAAFVAAARQALEQLPRAQNGEVAELQAVLKHFLPPGAPRPDSPASRVIRLHSEFLGRSDQPVDMGKTVPAVLTMRKRSSTPPPPIPLTEVKSSKPTLRGTPPVPAVPLLPQKSEPLPINMAATVPVTAFPQGGLSSSGARLTPNGAQLARARRSTPTEGRVPADDLVPVAGELAAPGRQDRAVPPAALAVALPSTPSRKSMPPPRAPGLTAPLSMVEAPATAAALRNGHHAAVDPSMLTPRLAPNSFIYPGGTLPPVVLKPAKHRWAGAVGVACALILAVHFLVLPLQVLVRWGQPAKLVLQTVPDGVHITMDGHALPQVTPALINVARDRKRHVIEFSKDGYETVSRIVRFDRSVRLIVKAQLPTLAGPSFQQLPVAAPAADAVADAEVAAAAAGLADDPLVPAEAAAAVVAVPKPALHKPQRRAWRKGAVAKPSAAKAKGKAKSARPPAARQKR